MTNLLTHKNRVAVVTGADRGAKVVVVDLTFPTDTVTAIGGNAIGVVADVSTPAAWSTIAKAASEAFGDVDIVVNNAAYYPNHAIDELDLETWNKTMTINLTSHFLSAKQFVLSMRKNKWGCFVGIGPNSIGSQSMV